MFDNAVGMIDDEIDQCRDYADRLREYNINLFVAPLQATMDDIVFWLSNNNIKTLLIDYKLSNGFNFNGADLFAFINGEIPDLPCFIVTNFVSDSIHTNLVSPKFIIDREKLAESDLSAIVKDITDSISIFNKRLELNIKNYEILFAKKNNNTISVVEEERFYYLFKILRLYNEIDDISTEMLKPETQKRIDLLIDNVNKLIDGRKD
jgi:hypothetical protein